MTDPVHLTYALTIAYSIERGRVEGKKEKPESKRKKRTKKKNNENQTRNNGTEFKGSGRKLKNLGRKRNVGRVPGRKVGCNAFLGV